MNGLIYFEDITLSTQHLINLSNGSTRSPMFFKIDVLNNFGIFTGKQLCWSRFNKVAGLQTCNIMKFLSKVFFFIEQLWWLVTSGFQGCRKRSVSWNQYLEFYHLICFKIWNIDPFYIDPKVSTSEWYRPNEKNFTYSCLGLGGPLFQEYSTFSRASHQRCSFKKGILKISQSSQENTSVGLPLQIKLQT